MNEIEKQPDAHIDWDSLFQKMIDFSKEKKIRGLDEKSSSDTKNEPNHPTH